MYEDRPKISKPIRELISELAHVFTLEHNDYIGLDSVLEYTGLPYKQIVDAVLNNKLKASRFGDLSDNGGFPLTRWEWVDEWLATL